MGIFFPVRFSGVLTVVITTRHSASWRHSVSWDGSGVSLLSVGFELGLLLSSLKDQSFKRKTKVLEVGACVQGGMATLCRDLARSEARDRGSGRGAMEASGGRAVAVAEEE